MLKTIGEKNKLENIDLSIYDVVSFDIFDTLIVRPFWEPSDLFYLLQSDKCSKEIAQKRINAEKKARKKNVSVKDEITLNEIYAELDENIGLLKNKEIELEIELCKPRRSIKCIYEQAVDQGKIIICISDMYLPHDVIRTMLNKCGYDKVDRVFLSSEYLKTKAQGSLYDVVLKELKVEANKVIHFGDNYLADIISAENKGIKTFFCKTIRDIIKEKFTIKSFSHLYAKSVLFQVDNIKEVCLRSQVAIFLDNHLDGNYNWGDTSNDELCEFIISNTQKSFELENSIWSNNLEFTNIIKTNDELSEISKLLSIFRFIHKNSFNNAKYVVKYLAKLINRK